MNKTSLIETRNLTKVFVVGGQEIKAVDNVNLILKKGEFLSLMGPSGSGKTTLLNLLGFLDKPTKGKIYFEGKDISQLSEKEKESLRLSEIGFIFQTFNLLPTLTALENVALPGLLKKLPKKERIKKAKELLSWVGLSLRHFHFPSQLSAGENQRVAIARALFNQPKIIFADEPTGNLDLKSKKEVAELLSRINQEYKTAILLVTHDPKIAQTASLVLKMIDGRIE